MSFLTQLAYTSSYNYSSSTDGAAGVGIGLGMIFFMLIIGIAAYVFMAVCLMKIFQKAGRQDAWAAWVPIYNGWVLFEIAGRPGWWALAGLIPFVGSIIALAVGIIAYLDLAKSFGKDTGFAVLLILVPIVGFPMLAFGSDQYRGPAGPEGAKGTAIGFQQPGAPVQFQPQPFQPQPSQQPGMPGAPVQPPVPPQVDGQNMPPTPPQA